MTDSKNKKVIDAGKKLGHAIAILRTDFSKETARKKKGGELTAKEKAQFEKIKAQQKDLLAKIDKLKAKAVKDKALVHGLNEIEKNAKHIVKALVTLDAFVAALYTIDEIEGLLYGYDYYVDKSGAAIGSWSIPMSLHGKPPTTNSNRSRPTIGLTLKLPLISTSARKWKFPTR